LANTLTATLPKIFGQALPTLRQSAITPRLVNSRHSQGPGQHFKTVDIPVPQAQTAGAVTSAITVPANTDHTTSTVQVVLDQWYSTRFHLDDQQQTQIDAGATFVPAQLGEAIKAVGNQIDTSLLTKGSLVGYSAGTAGTTPFASESTFNSNYTAGARKILNDNLAPSSDRFVVMDADAEGNLVSLAKFTDADRVGDTMGIREGEIGRKLGSTWFLNQNVVTHTSSGSTGNLINDAAHAVGATDLDIDGGTGTIIVGDLITIAGDTQTYSVTSVTGSAPATNVGIFPASKVALADDAAVTVVASRDVNLAFHRDAFALAFASFAPVDPALGVVATSITDPVTGVTMRLQVRREYMQTTWEVDALWGVKDVRPELACQILG